MEITPLDLDDAVEMAEWARVAEAVRRADAPWARPVTPLRGVGRFRHGWDGEPEVPYLGRVDGQVVAWGSTAVSDYDNLDLIWYDVQVDPARRRQGIGSEMLAFLEAEGVRLGRPKPGGGAWDVPGSLAFAARHGYHPKNRSITRRQVLAELDVPALDALLAEAWTHAGDYTVEQWAVPTPAGELDALAAMAESINDAPIGDLDYEDEAFSGERMAAYEQAWLGRGDRLHRLVARHRDTGALAGHTVMVVSGESPSYASQHDTAVARDHRGHRLGLVLKLEMLQLLRSDEPRVEVVDTNNAESNSPMISVNELIGYRAVGAEVELQRD